MESEGLLPLRRVQLPLHKFCDVAIPIQIETLQKHRQNLEKLEKCGKYTEFQKELMNSRRTVQQLIVEVQEMEVVRSHVQPDDLAAFDKRIFPSKKLARETIRDFTESYKELMHPVRQRVDRLQSPGSIVDDATTVEEKNSPGSRSPTQTQLESLQVEQLDLDRKREILNQVELLEKDLCDLGGMVTEFSEMVHHQQETLDRIIDNIEFSEVEVQHGVRNLERAARLKAFAYPLTGALIGGCVGGPVGFVAGIKFGGLAAIGGGVLGFTGGHLLRRIHNKSISRSSSMPETSLDKSLKKSSEFEEDLGPEPSSPFQFVSLTNKQNMTKSLTVTELHMDRNEEKKNV